MKSKLLFLVLLFLNSTYATEWHVSPTGTPTGLGTITSPLDLQTALTNNNLITPQVSIQPGDTVWLHGGVYTGRFKIYLQGNTGNPIIVASFPGETAVLNGNLNYLPPITPPIVNLDLQKKIKKFIYTLEPEQRSNLYELAFKDPTYKYKGILIKSVDSAVLEVYGGNVYFKKFEITNLGSFSRNFSDLGFYLLFGIENLAGEDCKFIELVVYNNPGVGVGTWKYTGGSEFNGCLIYNNGYYDAVNKGHGSGFYVQNITNKRRLLKNNTVFNNYYIGHEIYSDAIGTVGTVFDYVKNTDLEGSTIFNAGSPIGTTVYESNIKITTNWSDLNTAPNIPRDINVLENTTYYNTDYTNSGSLEEGTSLDIGGIPTAPVHNVHVYNNFISGRNDGVRFSYADNTFRFHDNIYWGRYIYHKYNNPPATDIVNWNFYNNTYYTNSFLAFRYVNPGGVTITDPLSSWQTNYTIDNNSFRYPHITFQEYSKVRQFTYSPNKYLVSIVKKSGANVSMDFSSYGIAANTPYRIIDVENYHAESNPSFPFTGVYNGVGGITFNMQSTQFESPQGNTIAVKTPTNFGCFIIEFDICQNTTAQLLLPSQACSNAGAIIDLASYVTSGPTNGVFSGAGVVQNGASYSFNPTIAGSGSHLISYAFVNNVGCPTITITGNITVIANCKQPYISQTYAYGTDDKFIEVKNSSDTQNIVSGNYYLALYKDGALTTNAPTSFINLGNIPAQGTKVYKNPIATAPAYALTSTDWTGLSDFDGDNDVLVLTTTTDATAYANRVDLFGDTTTLGKNTSLVRTSCAPQVPRTDAFDEQDWVAFTDLEVSDPNSKTNAVLGRHYDKSLSNTNTNTWDETDITDLIPAVNESLPDRSRILEIANDYNTTTYGDFEACSLTVRSLRTLTITLTHNIKVQVSVNVLPDGQLIIQNQGSLVMVRDCYYGICGSDLINLGANSTMQTTNQTVNLDSGFDYVFWSSPLSTNSNNPVASQIFNFGTNVGQFRPHRFYLFQNQNFCDIYRQFNTDYFYTDSYDDNFDDYMPFTHPELVATNAINSLLIPGRGYNTWPPIGSTNYSVTFKGQMNNGLVTVPAYRNNSEKGTNDNLVGNPYPSPIDLDVFFAENSSVIDPIAYIWTRLTDDPAATPGPNQLNYTQANFSVYTTDITLNTQNNSIFAGGSTISTGQSFFVNTHKDFTGFANAPIAPIVGSYNVATTPEEILPAGNIVFKNKMRTTVPNTTFSKMTNNKAIDGSENTGDKLWINLTDTNNYAVQIGIYFKPTASASFVRGEDAQVIQGRKYNFYTQSTSENLMIDVQDSFNTDKIIPLGILNASQNQQQTFVISIPKKSGIFASQAVYLEDLQLRTIHNLSQSSYSFTTNGNAVIEGRFRLRFTNSLSNFTYKSEKIDNDILLKTENNDLSVISKNKKIQSIQVFDIYTPNTSGMLLINKENINAKEVILPLQSNSLLLNVRVILEDGTIINKKIAK